MLLLSLGLARSDGRKINVEPWSPVYQMLQYGKSDAGLSFCKIALSQWYDETVKMAVEPTMHLRAVGSPAQGIEGL